MSLPRLLLLGLGFFAGICTTRADNWTGFRGNQGDGVSTERDVPLIWSPKSNILWKVPLPGPGSSSPVIWENRLFLTQSLDPKGKERALLCLDTKSGKELWRKVIPFEGKEPTHATNPYCSATPATDGRLVVSSFGSAGVTCHDFDGKELWRKDLGSFVHIWGNASSPVIHGDRVYLNCGPGERTFLVALEKSTGKELWRHEEPGGKAALEKGEKWLGSWSTPLIHRVGGKDQIVMSWSGALKGHDPESGKVIWSAGGLTELVYTSPLANANILVGMSGYGGAALAIHSGGEGDITQSHRLWHHPRNAQRIGGGDHSRRLPLHGQRRTRQSPVFQSENRNGVMAGKARPGSLLVKHGSCRGQAIDHGSKWGNNDSRGIA
jgi:outer membrane protein assembly factor BamB